MTKEFRDTLVRNHQRSIAESEEKLTHGYDVEYHRKRQRELARKIADLMSMEEFDDYQ